MVPTALAAQSMTTLRLASTPQVRVGGTIWSEQNGTFPKNGMDVSIVSMNSGAAMIAAILGGSLDIGNISLFDWWKPTRAICPSSSRCCHDLRCGYSRCHRDDRRKRLADPIRPRHDRQDVAVPALGDTFTIASSTWIDKTGGDSSTVKFLELPNAAAADAIAGGRVDAAISRSRP